MDLHRQFARALCAIGLHRWVRESWLTCQRQRPDPQLCARCYRYRDTQP